MRSGLGLKDTGFLLMSSPTQLSLFDLLEDLDLQNDVVTRGICRYCSGQMQTVDFVDWVCSRNNKHVLNIGRAATWRDHLTGMTVGFPPDWTKPSSVKTEIKLPISSNTFHKIESGTCVYCGYPMRCGAEDLGYWFCSGSAWHTLRVRGEKSTWSEGKIENGAPVLKWGPIPNFVKHSKNAVSEVTA